MKTLRDALWRRHANPLSGWSRLIALPVFMYALYARRKRLLALVAGFLAVNPVLFSPPADADAWMTRVVLGERLWYRHKQGQQLPDFLNYLNGPISAAALYAAYRRRPVQTAVLTALTMVTKLLFVGYVAHYYDHHYDEFPEDIPDFATQ